MSPDKIERYLYGNCALLARAIREQTGWPLAVIDDDIVWHVGVIAPGGRFLDAGGLHDGYQYEEVDDHLSDADLGRQPDDEVRADATELLHEIGVQS